MAVPTNAPCRRVKGTLIRGVFDDRRTPIAGLPLRGAKVVATARIRTAQSAQFIVLDPVAGYTDNDAVLRSADTGEPGLVLLVTDNPALGIVDWTWHFEITAPSLEGAIEFDMPVPSGTEDIDLSSLDPIPGADGQVVFVWRDAVQAAADDAVEQAVADAMQAALATDRIAYRLIEGRHFQTELLTALGGTPTFGSNFLTGGKVGTQGATTPRDEGAYTLEFLFRSSTAPTSVAVLVQWAGVYVGLRANGHPFISDPSYHGSSTAWICDDGWHHVAVVYTSTSVENRVTVNGLYIDGIKRAGDFTGAFKQADGHVNVGGFRTNDSANFYAGRYRNVRISKGARYSANFTPATIQLDATTVFFASLDNTLSCRRERATGYPNRPLLAPPGSVTYVGLAQPTDALAKDEWQRR